MKGLQTLFQVGIHRPAENSSKLIEGVLDEIIVDAMDIVENKEVSEYNSEVVTISSQNGHKPKQPQPKRH